MKRQVSSTENQNALSMPTLSPDTIKPGVYALKGQHGGSRMVLDESDRPKVIFLRYEEMIPQVSLDLDSGEDLC